MFSVTKIGLNALPLYTLNVRPTKSGVIVERRDHVLITFFSGCGDADPDDEDGAEEDDDDVEPPEPPPPVALPAPEPAAPAATPALRQDTLKHLANRHLKPIETRPAPPSRSEDI